MVLLLNINFPGLKLARYHFLASTQLLYLPSEQFPHKLIDLIRNEHGLSATNTSSKLSSSVPVLLFLALLIYLLK